MAQIEINSDFKDKGLKQIRPNPNMNKGINLVYLDEVEAKSITVKGDSGMIEFRGMEIPSLQFVWNEITKDKEAEPAKHIERFMPLSKKLCGEFYNSLLTAQIAQILQIIKGHVNLTTEDYAKLNVFNEEFDETDGDVASAIYAKFYGAVYELLHKTVKKETTPVYKVDGKPVPMWLKLVWNSKGKFGKFSIPTNKSPFYEPVIGTKPTTLFIDITKKETIIPTIAPTADKANEQAMPGMENKQNGNFQSQVPEDFFTKVK